MRAIARRLTRFSVIAWGVKVMSRRFGGAITAAIAAIALVHSESDGKRKATGAYVKDDFP
jgi:hypothetical protein